MEVILLEKVPQLGDPGDLVNVKAGYGKNFLIPTGKAVKADEKNKAKYEKRKEALLSAEADRKNSAQQQAKKMQSLSLTIPAQVSEEGTLYGSMGTREIADALSEKGYETEKSSFRLPEGVLKRIWKILY
jgi:ribosomal protein L9